MEQKTLSQLQTEAAELLGEELKHPRVGATLGLVEELGELVKEIMEIEIYRSQSSTEELRDEVGDVLFSLLEVCTAYGISLEEAYNHKVEKIRAKRADWIEKFGPNLQEIRAKLD